MLYVAGINVVIGAAFLVFLVPLLLFGWRVTWRLWRYGKGPKHESRTGFSSEYLAEQRREMPVSTVCVTCLVILVGTGLIFGHQAAAAAIELISGIGFFAAGLLLVSVHYRRRPRWCIPPSLREDRQSSEQHPYDWDAPIEPR